MNYYDGEMVYEHLIYFCFVYDDSVDTLRFLLFSCLWGFQTRDVNDDDDVLG